MENEKYQEIGKALAEQHGTNMGQLFGKPCIKLDNKAFAAFFKGEMVFKLGKEEIALLSSKYEGSQNWDPSGKKRPMKDWLQVPIEYESDWSILALQALNFLKNSK